MSLSLPAHSLRSHLSQEEGNCLFEGPETFPSGKADCDWYALREGRMHAPAKARELRMLYFPETDALNSRPLSLPGGDGPGFGFRELLLECTPTVAHFQSASRRFRLMLVRTRLQWINARDQDKASSTVHTVLHFLKVGLPCIPTKYSQASKTFLLHIQSQFCRKVIQEPALGQKTCLATLIAIGWLLA